VSGALTFELLDSGVGIITLDVPGERVNTLRRELADELGELLDGRTEIHELRALVLISGKAEGFVAGADLGMLRELERAGQGEALSRLLQQTTARIESLAPLTVAALHGDCLGGGLELALAFDARIAADAPATRLGLPEVQLGLLPGGGGTWRLPRLVGLRPALDLMLTGRRIDAARARAIGLVDALAPQRALREEAVALALRLAALAPRERRRILDRPMHRLRSRAALLDRLLTRTAIGRRIALSRARASTLARTRGNYPAPVRILRVVEAGLAGGEAVGLAREARAFGELCVSEQSRALVALFFASRSAPELAQDAPAVRRVALIGGGLMGTGIAFVSALRAGVEVMLRDRDRDTAERARSRLAEMLDGRARRGRLDPAAREQVLARVRALDPDASLHEADLVIEAVFEDLALKRRILAEVQRDAPHAVFASNTSALPISRIAEGCRHPEQVAGMHYFSPVERMPLLEVVAPEGVAPRTLAACAAFGRSQGKTVVVVRDGPGFYTTRILAPYMNEAARLVSEGAPVDAVDEALLDFGFPLGPLALLDEVGIDVAAEVAATLVEAFGERMRPPRAMQGLVADGRQGRKNGRGFYRHLRGGARRPDPSVYTVLHAPRGAVAPVDAAERCVALMVNEAVRCLDEGIVASAADADVAAVFGLGFPPFRGGPLRYADRVGAAHLLERLDHLAVRHGPRFEPAERLRCMAEQGLRFHHPTRPPAGGRDDPGTER